MVLKFHRESGKLGEQLPDVVRTLGDLAEIYDDLNGADLLTRAYEVYNAAAASGRDQLLTGTCIIYPGIVGQHYYMTKGHRHVVPRAEIYIGVSGEGILLMQHEQTGECKWERIEPDTMIYVPPLWAHRHVNSGATPLVTLFAVSADAGHDYEHVRKHPFRLSVVCVDGVPEVVAETTNG